MSGTVTGSGGASGVNNIFVDAENSAHIVSVSLAAAIAVTAGGNLALAGGGAGSGSIIRGATYAVVNAATVSGADMMSVDAQGTAIITTVVVGIAVSVTAGNSGAAFSIGIAASTNSTEGLGRNVVGLPTDPGYIVAARIVGSDITLNGALNVNALSDQKVKAVVLAASVAVAATSGFGLAAAGAGAGAGNYGQSRVLAEIVGNASSNRVTANGITVHAINVSEIISVVGAAAVGVSIAGGSSVAIAVSAAVGVNEIDASTVARITGLSNANGLDAGAGTLNILADTKRGAQLLKINTVVASAAVAVAGSGATAVAVSGAGAFAFNRITGETVAELTNITNGSAGAMNVKATNEADIDANVISVAASVAASGGAGAVGVSIGAVAVSNKIGKDDDIFTITA